MLSDFLNRTFSGNLTGLLADGTPRRGAVLVDPQGMIVWEHVCDNGDALHHVEEALKALREHSQTDAHGAQGGADSDSEPDPVSVAPETPEAPQGGFTASGKQINA